MEDRVKERLTGAVILVALVVVLIPELFRGERAGVQTAAPTASDGLPLRSYTIDLDQQPSTANGQPGADNSAKSLVVSEVAAIAPLPVEVSAAAVPPTTLPDASGRTNDTPLVTALPASPLEAAIVKPSRVAGGAGWVVQLGTFSRRENAERMVTSAGKKGVQLAVAGPDARGLYRVRTSAVVADRQAAAALQDQLKAQGYSGMINASQ